MIPFCTLRAAFLRRAAPFLSLFEWRARKGRCVADHDDLRAALAAHERAIALMASVEAAPAPAQRPDPVAAAQRAAGFVTEDDIADLIEAFGRAKGWSSSYAAKVASGQGDMVALLRSGRTLKLRRANQIVDRIDALWPEGAPWPKGPITRKAAS